MSVLEAGMLICFGASWPFAVIKTYKTKDVEGISSPFLFLLLLGYVFGILHKILYSLDIVITFYIINCLFVLTEIILYYRYRGRHI